MPGLASPRAKQVHPNTILLAVSWVKPRLRWLWFYFLTKYKQPRAFCFDYTRMIIGAVRPFSSAVAVLWIYTRLCKTRVRVRIWWYANQRQNWTKTTSTSQSEAEQDRSSKTSSRLDKDDYVPSWVVSYCFLWSRRAVGPLSSYYRLGLSHPASSAKPESESSAGSLHSA